MSEMAASGGSWCTGETPAVARAGWGAAEHRWHDGAGGSARRSRAGRCVRVSAAAAGRGGVRERARARLRRDGRGSRRARGGKRSPVISPAVSGAVAWSREGKERGGPDGRGRAVSERNARGAGDSG